MLNLYGFLVASGLTAAAGANLTAKGRLPLYAVAVVAFLLAALDAWFGLL